VVLMHPPALADCRAKPPGVTYAAGFGPVFQQPPKLPNASDITLCVWANTTAAAAATPAHSTSPTSLLHPVYCCPGLRPAQGLPARKRCWFV
jgi:hypothetical protein